MQALLKTVRLSSLNRLKIILFQIQGQSILQGHQFGNGIIHTVDSEQNLPLQITHMGKCSNFQTLRLAISSRHVASFTEQSGG
jgi:hypothetical protein